MILTRPQIVRIYSRVIKNCCRASPRSRLFSSDVSNESFGVENELKIVNTINECSPADFAKYDIKEAHLKRLIDYREKNGPFKTLDDVLLSQDVPTFIKLCKSIIDGGRKVIRLQTPINEAIKKCVVVPPLTFERKKLIKNIVAFHVWGTKISWVLLNDSNHLSHWKCEEFQVSSKANLLTQLNLLIKIASKIPHADAYVMQADGYVSFTKLKPAAYAIHLQCQQIISIMISLLGLRHQSVENGFSDVKNIYTIPRNAASQIFGLKVGSESVSSDSLVSDILAGKNLSHIVANCPSVSVDLETVDSYKNCNMAAQQQMNSVLLDALIFANFVRNNLTTNVTTKSSIPSK